MHHWRQRIGFTMKNYITGTEKNVLMLVNLFKKRNVSEASDGHLPLL